METLGQIIFTGLNLINCKIFTILHHPHCCYVYIPSTTCLHIPLAHTCLYYYLLSPQYTVLHILLFIFDLYLCIFSCVVLHILHCPLSGPDLIYISLLIISCIIEYVTNKRTLNLEPWTRSLWSVWMLWYCWWISLRKISKWKLKIYLKNKYNSNTDIKAVP